MKKIMSLLLALCLVGLSAASAAETKEETDPVLLVQTILDSVAETYEIISSVYEINRWQLDDSQETLAAYKEAVKNGEDFQTGSDEEEVRQKADQLGRYITRVEALEDRVEAMDYVGLVSIDKTISAAKVYFNWLGAAMRDLMSIFDFYFAEQEAGRELAAYNSDDYSDVGKSIEDLYFIIDDMTAGMAAIQCPPYMRECFNRYINTTGVYCSILNSMYTAVQLNDVLRSTSAQLLTGRMAIQIANCEIELTELFNLQYEKVEKRIDGDVETLRRELNENCAALLAAMM